MSCSVAIASSPVFSPESLSSPFRSTFQRAAISLLATRGGFGAAASPPLPLLPLGSSGSRSALKRKRPARIDIPSAEALPFKTEAADGRGEVAAESARYSVYSKKGRKRLEMEDRHKVSLDLNGNPKLAFFGIFDGHGGKKAAEFASENLDEFIVEEMSAAAAGAAESSRSIEEIIRTGYLKTDAEFLKEQADGGACCVTALVRDGDLIVSNAGDCRAVLSRAGKAVALTSDHRPSREDERDRIESVGGYVDYRRGTWRLQGSLAISRGIGDSHLKQWVIPVPETKVIAIDAECEFLILASDGLWDQVSNQEAVDLARPLCVNADNINNNASTLSACKKLVELSADRRSMDDISVMIVKLQHFV